MSSYSDSQNTRYDGWGRSHATFEVVREVLVEALGVFDHEVQLNATMINDLGVESIDFLDIIFRLERAFNIDIPRLELFPEDILTNTTDGYVEEIHPETYKVTAAGLKKLKERMLWHNFAGFEADLMAVNLGKFLTVGDLCNFIDSKLSLEE